MELWHVTITFKSISLPYVLPVEPVSLGNMSQYGSKIKMKCRIAHFNTWYYRLSISTYITNWSCMFYIQSWSAMIFISAGRINSTMYQPGSSVWNRCLDNWAISCVSLLFESLVFSSFIPPATEYHLGLLKAKLAKYRSQLLEPSKSAGAKGEGFDVMKSGDARVALIGFPSVGKVGQQSGCWVVLRDLELKRCFGIIGESH